VLNVSPTEWCARRWHAEADSARDMPEPEAEHLGGLSEVVEGLQKRANYASPEPSAASWLLQPGAVDPDLNRWEDS
jgi:hypothetical protein